MKVGVGTVGRAAALALLQRETGPEPVYVDRRRELAQWVALDLDHVHPASPWGPGQGVMRPGASIWQSAVRDC